MPASAVMAAGSILVSARPSLDAASQVNLRAPAATSAGQDVPTDRISISDDAQQTQLIINQDDNTALLRQLQMAPSDKPEDSLELAEQVRSAALSPGPPLSAQDLAVATAADQMAANARAELARRALEQYQRNQALYA